MFAKGTCTWLILMVQVQLSSAFETTANNTQPKHTNEAAGQPSPPQAPPADKTNVDPHVISTESSFKAAVLPDVTDFHLVTNGFTERDVLLRPQYTPTTQATSFLRRGIKPEYGEAAVTSSNIASVTGGMSPPNVSNEEHLKFLIESPCISEMSGESTLEEESQEAAINVEEQAELIVKGNQSSHFDSGISQDDQHAPLKIIKNGNGVLKNIGEAFILETQLQGKRMHIEIGKAPWVAFEDGKGKRCQTPMPDLRVGFDAHFVDIPYVGPVGHILALWSGKKPLKASLEDSTYYFDAPGVYHGSDEKECFKFMVMLEGKVTFITTTSTTAIFGASGEHCASLTTFSHVFLHLSLAQDTWTLFLVVHQPKHKSSHLTQVANSFPAKSLSLPELDTSRSYPPNSQAESKTGNWNHMPATHNTSHVVEVLTHYLKNLTGTLAQAAEKRVVHTQHKNIPLSVEVPENCSVDVNAVALNVKEISLGTKLHLDAFCENTNSLSYWAAVVWSGKKSRKSVARTGCILYYNVLGRCLNSNEKEVSLEFTLENKIEHVVCKNAYIIMPDGTFQALENLRAGTPIHANLLQQNQNFSVNNFIYVGTAAAQPTLPPMIAERKPEEESTVTSNMTKKMNKEKSVLGEPPAGALIDNLKNSEVKLESSSLKSMAAYEKEGAAASPDLVTQENEYDVVKGIISQLQHDIYIFSDDKENLKVNINPMEIAVDPHLSPESPVGEFYLVYHKKTKVGMCGWYRHQTRQVYLQHNMVVHTHSLASKIITLGLPDHSSFYNFLFDSEIIVTGNKLCRLQQLKSGKRVHPIIEDIKPLLIDGCVISHRIALMTTVKGLAVVCLNFLKHSLFGNQEKKIPSNGSIVSMNHSLPKDNNEPCGDSSGRGQYEDEGLTYSLSDSINIDASLKQQQQVKRKDESEGNLNESLEFLSTSEGHSYLDKYHGGSIPIMDGEGDTLRELISTRHPKVVSKAHMTRYVTLCGEIRPGDSGTHVFCSRKLPSPIKITHNIPHCVANMCESTGKIFMLARKMYAKETGIIDHQPVVVWPEERKCDPYIIVTYKVSRKKNLLLITDAADEKEKWYLCDYNLVFSLKNSYKINEVIQSYSKQDKMLVLYAVVDNIPPFQIQGQYVEGNILLLTTSKNVAVSSIDVFIGSCHEEELLFQEPHSPVLQMLHLHKVRMDRASRCKRGSTYYLSLRDSSFESNLKLVGGCLEAHTDDFAIISCGRKSSTAVCHFSNVYYQGENIASWETIPKHHWKNFWAITLPLDEAVKEAKWEVDAVALVAWCCRGPKVLAMHQCYYHVPTPYVPYHGTEESQETSPTNPQQSQGNSSHSLESCAGTVMSLAELESWQCQAGSTIFAFHENILQSCGLIKMCGKITLVNGIVVLFTSTENEVVKCKISDVFMKGRRCESVKKVASEIDQIFTLVAQKCTPTIYLGKTIQMEAIIAFTGSLKLTGIHICNKHACILESNLHKEEIAIAEEAFHDIALSCEQSAQCSDYHLSKITTSEVETPMPPDIIKNMKHTLCYGFIMGIDNESPGQVRVSLQQGPESLILPVSRSRLMGLHRNLSLQHVVGHPLKVILYSVTRNEREECRILLGWGNFSEESRISPCSILEPEIPCSQKSKFPCCPRGLEVKEFQSLYNSNMFEFKSLYKLKKIDVESNRGFFHYWLDERLVTCKIESIVGWPKVNQVQEELWNLLVPKGLQTGEECPEAVAAWQGDDGPLVVEVCDVHGTHGLNLSPGDKRKAGNKSIPSSAKKGRCNSESQYSGLPTSPTLMLSSRYRHNSEPQNTSLSSGIKLKQSCTVEEDNSVLSRSFPYRTGYPFGSGLYVRSREYRLDLQQNKVPSSITRTPFVPVSSRECNASEDIQEIVALCSPKFKERLCTVLSIEDEYVVFQLHTRQILALWEDIWCQKETLKVEMKLQVVSAKFSKHLSFSAHNFRSFAVLVYMCDREPEEASTIKFNWSTGATEKFAQIRGELDSKMKTINLRVKIRTANAQPNPTDQLLLQSYEPMEDMTLAVECELLKIMDECGILKVKNTKVEGEEIKVFFQRSVVLINNKTVSKQEWKESLQMLSEQRQTWQCSSQKLTPQESECVKEKTGEEVQYKAELVWCRTCISAQGVHGGDKTVLGTALTPKALSARSADFGSYATQLLTDDNTNTNKTSEEGMHPPPQRSSEFPSVQPFHPSMSGSVVSSWSEFLLQNKAKTEGNFVCFEGAQNDQYMHTPHKGSLWAARPTLRIIHGKQETISECIVGGYADHCGFLTSARGPVLFDRKVISVTQQEEIASGTSQCEQEKKSLKALVLELEQPVEILGCEVRKIAMVMWNGEKPEVDNDLISKSLDVYKLNWIVVIICNVSALTKNYRLKKSVCHSFYATSFQDYDTSCCQEILYYCSQDYSVRQHEVILVSLDSVLLKHQDSLVLAMRDDVKCSENYLKEGKHLWVIAVRLIESFYYYSHLITHFALLVYSGEMEPPEAVTIKLDWSRGKIEKLTSLERKVSCGLEKVNIRIKVDRPADVRLHSMDPLWPLTSDRPEGDMIFAVECEVLKLMKNCGLLKAKGRMLKGNEIRIFFLRDAVLINSKGLSVDAALAVQMLPVQKQAWRCTGQRLMPQERERVKKRTGEEAQYKAHLVWCEICPSVQGGQIAENKDVTNTADSTALPPGTPAQSEGPNVLTVGGQVERIESLSAVDTPLTTGSKPKRRHKSKKNKDKDSWGQDQKQSTRMGHLTEVHRTVAQVVLEDEQLKYVAREKCFLYGVCLDKVELWHVLSIGLSINYELTEDGKELKKVWVGDVNTLEPALLVDTLREWCLIHNVTPSANTILLLEAGWLPSELTPTVAPEEDKNVVEVTAPPCGFLNS